MTVEQALAILGKLEKELDDRQADVKKFSAYYRGEQPLRFASDQFKAYFAARYKGFSDNWCGVVGDSPAERLTVTGIRPADQQNGDDDLWRAWSENGLDADSGLAFVDAFVAKRSYVLVWADEAGNPEVTFEHPSQAIVSYEAGSRRKRKAALKKWHDDGTDYATLYLPNEVWKFQRQGVKVHDGRTDSGLYVAGIAGTGWQQRQASRDKAWPMRNPLGVVPMVELPNRPMLVGEPLSEIAGTAAMQDAVNLLWAHVFTTTDFAAFPARVILGAQRPVIPILDENGQQTGEQPIPLERFAVDRVQWVEDPNAKIDQWDAADLGNYTGVLETAVSHIAAQTRTPPHYLVGKMVNMSAEALKAAETGLVKKVQERQVYFGEAIKEMFRLIALVQGDTAKSQAVAAGSVLWKDAETRSEAQLVDSLLKLRSIGFPFAYLAERYGLSPTDLTRVLEMRAEEANSDIIGALADTFRNPPPLEPEAA